MSYQDYVIKNGKFIGQFDEMYRKYQDPWHQSRADSHELSKARNTAIISLRRFNAKSAVEFGCGLGHFAGMIRQAGIRVKGIDVSPIAIKKARANYPHITFNADQAKNISLYKADAVVFSEITWYVLPQLEDIFKSMLRSWKGKLFVHSLVFYQPGVQQYGKEYFTSLKEFIDYCPFKILEWDEFKSSQPGSTIGTNAVFRIQKK